MSFDPRALICKFVLLSLFQTVMARKEEGEVKYRNKNKYIGVSLEQQTRNIMSEGRQKDCVLLSPGGPDRYASENEAR